MTGDARGLTSAEKLRSGADIDPSDYQETWKRQIAEVKERFKNTDPIFEGDGFDFGTIEMDLIDTREDPYGIESSKAKRWKRLLDKYHYVPHSGESTKPYGRFLRYFAMYQGQPVALLAWSGSFLAIGDRDEFIGWDKEQRERNNKHMAQNLVFCILPAADVPNLASAILSRAEDAVKRDWELRYGDELAALDTLVAKEWFDGTSYKAANWKMVGETKGVGFKQYRKEKDGYGSENMGRSSFEHGIKKKIFVRPLISGWREVLLKESEGNRYGWRPPEPREESKNVEAFF